MQLKQQIDSCVRITVQIPKDAAQRLRQMAAEGNPALRALGIMSVQLDGDSVISIKLPGQEINLKTTDNSTEASSSRASGELGDFTQLLETAGSTLRCLTDTHSSGTFLHSQLQYRIPSQNIGLAINDVVSSPQSQHQFVQERRNMLLGGPSTSSAAQAHLQKQQMQQQPLHHQNPQRQLVQGQPLFKAPNTVCPMDGKVPVPPMSSNLNSGSNGRDYPFISMRQARVLQGRENALNSSLVNTSQNFSSNGSHNLTTSHNGQLELASGLGSSANIPLKVIKNSPTVEILSTSSVVAGNKSHFLQPPPPPYPGMGNTTSSVMNKPASQINKPVQNYLQKGVGGSSVLALQATTSTNPNNNNIAISSPLLVNLLQNDGNTVTNQLKLSPQTSLLPQHQHSSPLSSVCSGPQQSQNQHKQLVNSPMRTQTVASDVLDQTKSQQHTQLLHSVSDNALAGTSSPIGLSLSPSGNTSMRNAQQQQSQQIITSTGSNLYGQQHIQPNFHPQHIAPQQGSFLRHQRQQQLQAAVVPIGGLQSHRFMQQSQILQAQQQHQVTQQAGVGGIMLTNLHQQQQTHVRQVRPGGGMPGQVVGQKLHQQGHQFISSGGMSPAPSHSPASSHHSLHSPLLGSHQQQLLSPSTTPVQSPHSHPPHAHKHLGQQQQHQMQLQQQQPTMIIPPTASPSSHSVNILHSTQVPLAPTLSAAGSSTVGSGLINNTLPPPPDYNHTAISTSTTRWPSLNKAMDSVTKSSYQEFARYQMQYNLQQQQINNSHQSQPQKQDSQDKQINDHVTSTDGNIIVGMERVSPLDNAAVTNGLSDPLITLSDFEALTTNDLDALLPTLNCDLDSTLSLDDKNELESLLQDAKDLDLDLIEENLSAVGVDIDETAAAASSLLNAEATQTPPNATLGISTMQFGEQNIQIRQNIQQQPSFIGNSSIMPIQENLLQPTQNNNPQADKLLQQKLQLRQNMSHSIQQPQNPKRNLQQQTALQQQQEDCVADANHIRSKVVASVSSNSQKQFLINPLTGEMEPMQSDDSETEAEQETQQLNSTRTKTRTVSSLFDSLTSNHPSENLPSSLFLEDDSNSCGTAISKLSANDHNNGNIPGAGSDTERSRDSLTSNKSNRSIKPENRDGSRVSNKSVALLNYIGEYGTNKSPSPNIIAVTTPSSSITSAVVSATGVSQRKLKSNLVREKPQNSAREKRQDGNASSGATKPKRTKGNSRVKPVAASLFTNSAAVPTVSESASALAHLKVHPSEINSANEKIKLRLKLEKKEPVPPAYKVDVSFVSSQKLSTSETSASSSSSISSQIKSNNNTQHKVNINQNSIQPPTPTSLQHIQIEQTHSMQHQSIAFSNFTLPQASVSTPPTCSTEEPRVPPLHISLRGGKNSIVIKNSRKDRKKPVSLSNTSTAASSADGEDDSNQPSNKQLKIQNLQVPDAYTEIITQDKILPFYSSVSSTSTSSVFSSSSENCNNSITVMKSALQKTLPISSCELTSTIPSMTVMSTTPSFLGYKNGLTISAIKSVDLKSGSSSIDSKDLLVGSTNMGTLPFPPQLMQQSQFQKHLGSISLAQQQLHSTKIPSSLAGSITLNSAPNNCIVAGSNDNSVNVANRVINSLNLKTAATITPVGVGSGKPLTKIHKPPPYLTAVQQLQLQKHQKKHLQKQAQQFGVLSESQSAQQTIVAVATMLPSATTLKRVTVPKYTAEHVNLSVKAENILPVDTNVVKTSTDISPTSLTTNTVVGSENQSREYSPSESVPTISTVTNGCTSVSNVAISSNQGIIVSTASPALSTITLRNSPARNGSGTPGHGNGNGAGEDSGIESMDALSEKSPHQQSSSSPTQQQLSTSCGGGAVEKSALSSVAARKTSSVEAKKENTDVVDRTPKMASPILKDKVEENPESNLKPTFDDIEKALNKMEGFNDDFLEVTNNASTPVKGVVEVDCNPIAKAEFISATTPPKSKGNINREQSDDITEVITQDDTAKKLRERTEVGVKDIKQIPSIMVEDKAMPKLNDANLASENIFVGNHMSSKILSNTNSKFAATKIRDAKGKDELKTKDEEKAELGAQKPINEMPFQSQRQDSIFPPISIEIPTQNESDCSRIRTRASSRLGSPLDVNKASPTMLTTSIELNTNPTVSTINKPATTTRTSLYECVSFSPQLTTSNGSQLGNLAVLEVGHKRKRQESDTSANSSNNECSQEKRLRTGETSNAASNLLNDENEPNRAGEMQDALKNSCVRKCEESSDSDEPLIEVAEKVRNSKVSNATVISNDSTVHESLLSLVSAEKNELSNTPGFEKPTRNSRTIVHQSSTSNSTASMDSNSNDHNASTIAFATSAHSTRVNTNYTPTFTGSAALNNNNNNISDEKIGTRRSVRTSAGVHKNLYGRSVSSTSTMVTSVAQNADAAKSPSLTKAIGLHGTEHMGVVEARRKTRSAVIGEAQLTEGRRRRSSRDYK